MQDIMYSILIEGAGTATAISALKGLSECGIPHKTVLLDVDDFVAGRYLADVFYRSPPSKDENYVDFVLEVCRKESVNLYIPIIDYGFEKLSLNKKRFSDNGIYIMIADYPSVKICSDKYLTYKFFVDNHIPTPETFTVDEKENINFKLSFIMKPKLGGRTSLDVHKIDNLAELNYNLKAGNNFVIQRFIEGKEFTADCLSNLDGSFFIDAVIRERVATKMGLAIKARILGKELSERIKGYVAKIAVLLRLPGVYNIQGFVTAEGYIFFTEINPRFAGTHALNVKAGLNSIKHVLEMLNGKSVNDIKNSLRINYNIKMVRYWTEIFIEDDVNGDAVSSWKNLLKHSTEKNF